MVDPDTLAREFQSTFGRVPRIFRAPGRVNLIGEHTDYNDGFVLPVALDRSTWVAAAPRVDRRIVVRSREMDERRTFDLDDAAAVSGGPTGHWSDYVRGVAVVLDRSQRVRGADLLIATDVPIGAGLSSSAALEVACGYALLDFVDGPISLRTLVASAQRAEHEFVGTRCGIMDQTIACHGREGHAMLLDTRSLSAAWVRLPAEIRIVICNTMVAHRLASAEYNARRADCEAGVRVLATRLAGVRALRDVTLTDLEAARDEMPPRVFHRCRHVISENARVHGAVEALATGDVRRLGQLMADSHASLRDDYEVSCPELDAMVSIVGGLRGVAGARMTGGGFGGSVVAIVEIDAAEPDLRTTIQERYRAQTGLTPDVWFCSAGRGVGEWSAAVDAINRSPDGSIKDADGDSYLRVIRGLRGR